VIVKHTEIAPVGVDDVKRCVYSTVFELCFHALTSLPTVLIVAVVFMCLTNFLSVFASC